MNTDTGLDYVDIINTVSSMSGGKLSVKDPVSILSFYFAHKDVFNKLFSYVGSLIYHKEAVQNGTPVPVINPLNIPAPPQPVIPDTGKGVVISAIRNDNANGVYFIQEWQNGPGTGAVVPKDRFDAIIAGDATGQGSVIHYNFSPLDKDGKEIATGDPRHNMVNGGNPYMQFQIKFDGTETPWSSEGINVGPLELHAWDHDYGCTPNIKVIAGNVKGRHTVQLRVRVMENGPVSDWSNVVNVA